MLPCANAQSPDDDQDKAFSLFMRELEPRIWERIGFNIEENLGWAMVVAKKADMWRA